MLLQNVMNGFLRANRGTVILQLQADGTEIVYPPELATAELVDPAPAFGDR